jgi:hypothetical protein
MGLLDGAPNRELPGLLCCGACAPRAGPFRTAWGAKRPMGLLDGAPNRELPGLLCCGACAPKPVSFGNAWLLAKRGAPKRELSGPLVKEPGPLIGEIIIF